MESLQYRIAKGIDFTRDLTKYPVADFNVSFSKLTERIPDRPSFMTETQYHCSVTFKAVYRITNDKFVYSETLVKQKLADMLVHELFGSIINRLRHLALVCTKTKDNSEVLDEITNILSGLEDSIERN